MVANTLTLKNNSTEGDSIKNCPFQEKTLRDSPSRAHHAPSAVIRTVSVFTNKNAFRYFVFARPGNYFTK